ncbi:MAG: SPASM domain-containing protein, partial [Deltaproteobacteria bacterium]|nr:SPASM domain-containing protein [Deltaproteobacteria bacterium]
PVLWRGPLYVRVDGRAHACCHHFDAPPVGDLRTHSLDEVWNGAPMRRLRRLHATGRVDEIPACRACHFHPPAKPLTAASFLPSTDAIRRWMIRWERRKAFREAPTG